MFKFIKGINKNIRRYFGPKFLDPYGRNKNPPDDFFDYQEMDFSTGQKPSLGFLFLKGVYSFVCVRIERPQI